MKITYNRCAGLDVHQKTVYVCVRRGKGRKVETSTEVFGTFTSDLEKLRSMLKKHRVHRIIMESTGVYWMPVWNVLQRSEWKFDLVLVNPQHVKAIPGRKTDQQDCERLAELGQYNLLRGSFVPPAEIGELRDLTRRRTHLMGDRNRILNRIGRLLETANIKLGSVVSNLDGKTGWLILNALAQGETAPGVLAELAQGKLQQKQEELERSVDGYVNDHFRWLLQEHIDELAALDRRLNVLDKRIRESMQPYADPIRRLCTIPGIQETSAWTLIAELGTDMSQFPSGPHAASWAGLCPGHAESAGKRQSGRTRKGDRYLRRMLVQCAWAITRKKDCFLTALFLRIARRRGMKRAAMAVAHRMLVIAWNILGQDGAEYRELGGDFYDQRDPQKAARRLTERLERMGFAVTLEKKPAGEAPKPIRNGTTRWETPAARRLGHRIRSRVSSQEPRSPQLQDDLRNICPQCARWGIECIHAKNDEKKKLILTKSLEVNVVPQK